MSLRWKIVVLLAVLAAAATVAIGVTSYRSTSNELESTIDRSLSEAARRMTEHGDEPLPDFAVEIHSRDGGTDRLPTFEQVLAVSYTHLTLPTSDLV